MLIKLSREECCIVAVNDSFCKIFIDTDVEIELLCQVINGLVNGNADSWFNIKNEIMDLSVIKNDSFDAMKRHDFPDGFVYSRFYLEVEPKENIDSLRYIRSISLLLESLWAKGYIAVAACDFEDLLPRKGGYKYEIELRVSDSLINN